MIAHVCNVSNGHVEKLEPNFLNKECMYITTKTCNFI